MTEKEKIDTEGPFTAGLAVSLLSVATLFCALYAPVFISVSAVMAEAKSVTQSQGLVEFEKPVKKEAENSAPPIPDRLVAPSIGLDATIVNPRSRDYAVLDTALLDGVVYYPGSGYLHEDANLLFFGHSSFLPIVRNENFRVFNRIKDLRIGDTVELYVDGNRFIYRVTSNVLAKESEVRVNFGAEKPTITLATCNSFGAKEDRYVIQAELVNDTAR
ncbi:MAG: sortase [Candidatus Paceibacterota bacterium]